MSFGALALRHGRALFFASLAAGAAGLLTFSALPKAVYPEVNFPREQVVVELPGASSEAVLVAATRPMEEALASIPGISQVRSRTIRGAVELSLFFAPDTDMERAHPLVLARVAESRERLPASAQVTAQRVLPSGFPILSFNIEGPYPAARLYEIAQFSIRPALAGLEGVGLVSVQSSDVPELQVMLDPGRLRAAHLTVPEVAAKLKSANRVAAVARLVDAHALSLGVVTGELRSTEDIASVVVGGSAQSPVRVRDLGQVIEATQPRTRLIRVDGKPGVILNVTRRMGGDILRLDRQVHQRLAELKSSLPPGLEVIPVYEQATFVSDAVAGVRDAVLFGAVFAILVLALFLRDGRATFVAALSLPLTLAATLLVLRALGQTLNLMTLGGLAIAVGLVIDDAVVIVEAVHRHLEAGLSADEAARRGTDELFWPVVGTTATTVVVFLPLGLVAGVAGQFFSALATAIAVAVLISLVVALAVLPWVAARVLRPVRRPSVGRGLTARYVEILERALSKRSWVFIGTGVLLLAGIWVGARLPTDFLPEADEGSYVVDYFAPVSASMQDADALANRVEEVLRETPEVASFSRRLGAELGPPVATLSSRGDIAVRLKRDRSRNIEEIMDEQREKIAARVPGLRVEFVQVLADMLGDLEGSPEPVEVKLFGPDCRVLQGLAKEASGLVQGAPGLVDFFGGDEGCAPQLAARVDPLRAGREGLSTQAIADQLSGQFLGEVATSVRRPDHLEDVRVRLAREETAPPPETLLHAEVATVQGAYSPLSALANFEQSCEPSVLLRQNQRNLVHLTARLSGTSLGAAADEVSSRLRGLHLPLGYSWELGGLRDQQRESFGALLLALAVAVVVVLCVLLFQLRSFGLAASVVAATPLALAGAVLTLGVTGTSLNVSSMMGALLLVGLVVKNGILLLEHAQHAEERGLPRAQAIEEAARTRLRPILMTTAATLVALLPLVFGLGAGGELHRPLAIAVVGGLAFSTAATLFLVPALALLGAKSPPPQAGA